MSWPSVTVSTTNLDSGADNPALARADLLQAVQNLNTVQAARASANGVAPLGADAKVPVIYLPVGVAAGQVAAGDHTHSSLYQPLDADLTALAALSATGFAVRTGTDSWALRSLAVPAAGLTVTHPAGVAGNPTLALANDLAALEGLGGTGLALRTGTDAWTQVGIGIGAGQVPLNWMLGTMAYQSANDYQRLDADLTAIAGLAGTAGLLRKTAADTWALDTASYLTANQTITLSGDATGTGTTALSVTLANSGVSAGTYPKVTVNVKGLVTGGASLAAGDIPNLDWSKITSGKPTTLAGYGITDAMSTAHAANAITGFAGTGAATTVARSDHTHGSLYQPLDADLTAIAALAGTPGYLYTDGGGGWSVSTPAGGGGSQPADANLTALAALSGTGFAARTATDTWAARTLTAPAAGITITNPGGVAGNPTFALANDLAAVEGFSGAGLAHRTATDTWEQVKLGLGPNEVPRNWMLGGLAFMNASDLSLSAYAALGSANTFTQDQTIAASKALKLTTADGARTVGVRGPATAAADLTFLLPNTYGSSGQAIVSDGAGGLSFAAVGGQLSPDDVVAWAKFGYSGGTLTIQKKSSHINTITRTAAGSYAVTFTTAMPDANYVVVANAWGESGISYASVATVMSPTVSGFSIAVCRPSSPTLLVDSTEVHFIIIKGPKQSYDSAGTIVVPPTFAAGGWAWLNQGSATITDGAAWLELFSPGGDTTDQIRGIDRAITSGTFDVKAKISAVHLARWVSSVALYLRDSATGRITSIRQTLNYVNAGGSGEFYLDIDKWTNATTHATNYQRIGIPREYPWLRIVKDATNLTYYVSDNGTVWLQVYQVAKSDWVANIDKVGFYVHKITNGAASPYPGTLGILESITGY